MVDEDRYCADLMLQIASAQAAHAQAAKLILRSHHLARNSAVGHDMPKMASCPLVPRGAKATVRSVGDGFAVDVHGDDAATAAEIWRRAQLIRPAS